MSAQTNANERFLTLRVPGDLISTNAEAMRNEAGALLGPSDGSSRQWDIFRIDLSSAQMIDSVGLNLVVTLLKQVQERGGKMQVLYSSPNIFRTFNFTRLNKQVEMVKA